MGRIRTIKPEFWEDEKVGLLSRAARLLMLAALNLADDEGLLRWTPAFIKASVFMYDDDLDVDQVSTLMKELTDCFVIFPYLGGTSQQKLAAIVNFRKHQKINRPQLSKMAPPSLQNLETKRMYAARDGWRCGLCGQDISKISSPNDSLNLSMDHITPQSSGGTDHPSNIRVTHQACNKGRRDRSSETFTPPRSVSSLNDSVNASVNDSLPEGKGREQGKEGKTEEPPPPPVDFSKDHEPDIPEGLAIVQYAGFVCERAHIPASYGLKVKVGDAIRMLAQMESCSEARATALMVPRTMEAQKQGAKIHLWLDDGGWKTKTEVPGGSNQNVTRQRVDKGVGAVAEYLAKRGVSAVGNPGSADGAAIPVAGVGTVAGGIPVGLRTASGEVFAAASGASTGRVAHTSRPEILPKA